MDKYLIKACEDNMIKKFSYFPLKLTNMEVQYNDGLTVVDSDIPCDMFNIVCATRKISSIEAENIVNQFNNKKLPFAWWFGFEGQNEDLSEFLVALNLKKTEQELLMAVDLDNANYSHTQNGDIIIKLVNSQAMVDDIINVFSEVLPEEKCYIYQFFKLACEYLISPESSNIFFVGYYDDVPVSISSVFFTGKTAGIYDVCTVPDARGQGIAKAMTLHAMKFSKDIGCKISTLSATNDAKFLYEKLGYRALKNMSVYN